MSLEPQAESPEGAKLNLAQRGSARKWAIEKLEPRSGGTKRRIGLKGGSNSVVESQPSKLLVAGSIPVSRSRVLLQGCISCGLM